MAKVETPIAYLDAPAFKTFVDRDAEAAAHRGRAHRQGAGELERGSLGFPLRRVAEERAA